MFHSHSPSAETPNISVFRMENLLTEVISEKSHSKAAKPDCRSLDTPSRSGRTTSHNRKLPECCTTDTERAPRLFLIRSRTIDYRTAAPVISRGMSAIPIALHEIDQRVRAGSARHRRADRRIAVQVKRVVARAADLKCQ